MYSKLRNKFIDLTFIISLISTQYLDPKLSYREKAISFVYRVYRKQPISPILF